MNLDVIPNPRWLHATLLAVALGYGSFVSVDCCHAQPKILEGFVARQSSKSATRDSPSHRYLPANANLPTRHAYQSDQFRELLKEFQQLSEFEDQLGRAQRRGESQSKTEGQAPFQDLPDSLIPEKPSSLPSHVSDAQSRTIPQGVRDFLEDASGDARLRQRLQDLQTLMRTKEHAGQKPQMDSSLMEGLDLPKNVENILQELATSDDLQDVLNDVRRFQQSPNEGLDPSMMEDFSSTTKKLIRKLTMQSMNSGASKGQGPGSLSDWKQRFGFGGKQSPNKMKTPESSSNPANPGASSRRNETLNNLRKIAQRKEKIHRDLVKQGRLDDAYYEQAKSEFSHRNDTWSSDKFPSEEWMKKLQPFVNREVIEQLKVWRSFKDGKLKEMPKLGSTPRAPKSDKGLSTRMLESVVKSIDSGSSEWIKNAKEQRKGKKRKPSLFKQLTQSAKKNISKVNKSITNQTKEYTNAAVPMGGSRSNGSSGPSSRITAPSASQSSQVFLLAVLLVAVSVGVFYLFRKKVLESESVPMEIGPMDAHMIKDRASMICAVHSAAKRFFGHPSLFWHHRRLFSQLSAHPKCAATVTDARTPEIALLYEQARYAPDGDQLSPDELETARQWYQSLQDVNLGPVQ